MYVHNFMLFFVLVVVAGCSTKTLTADEYWYGQGYRFGMAGYDSDNRLLANLKDKVPFQSENYMQGYTDGKLEYCDPFSAFEKGISGTLYTGQCDGHKQQVMIEAEWQRGWDAFVGSDFFR
ncbi:DUF2799 domain-containing protein [Vibrio tapetis]|uniref:Lipoprotein n=1 Tax=Vibrio tapetis subsp. tapetis TaxID=1671868 RepID=A0A2N8ZBK4_9VIBR|nr:DUF2799 domain-containing protein [Vibrio tapetis]SON49294.1 conserved exported protein of unknown function [Vibrio tapetis subsp. tapetis]